MAHHLKSGGKEALRTFADELRPTNHQAQTTRMTAPRSMTAEIMKRQTVRRKELRRLVPLSDTTIYELEQKGEFPQRFYLTARCVVWPLNEVLAWLDERKTASEAGKIELAPSPDVRLRGSRPVHTRNARS
jgi:prophage regulatory protein